MTLTTRDDFFNALANNFSPILIDKASIANAAAGQYHSLWRATGQPGQGAIPTTAATCDNTLTGALPFNQQVAPATGYLGQLEGLAANAGVTIEIHDRLMQMGGLNGTLTTAQTVNLDLSGSTGVDNIAARMGSSNFRDVTWWAEWYADTGGTGVNLTTNVTYNDNSSGNLTAVALAATRRASFMLPLNGLVPSADSGKFIRDVNTATLSATTGSAGNFGYTATLFRGSIYIPLANQKVKERWDSLGMMEIANEACLFLIQLANTTSTGIVRGNGKIAHG